MRSGRVGNYGEEEVENVEDGWMGSGCGHGQHDRLREVMRWDRRWMGD